MGEHESSQDPGGAAATGLTESAVGLQAAMAQLGTLLLDEHGLEAVLELIVSLAATTIPAADSASVSVRVKQRKLQTLTWTTEEVCDLDRVQYDSDGPCVAAAGTGQRHLLDVNKPPQAWALFADACRSQGVTSTCSIPLCVRDEPIGALNLYSHAPGAADRWGIDAAETFGAHASAILANALLLASASEEAKGLAAALESRDLIGQAKGILMSSHRINADEAFRVLRQASQHLNRKLADVAADVVETGALPDLG